MIEPSISLIPASRHHYKPGAPILAGLVCFRAMLWEDENPEEIENVRCRLEVFAAEVTASAVVTKGANGVIIDMPSASTAEQATKMEAWLALEAVRLNAKPSGARQAARLKGLVASQASVLKGFATMLRSYFYRRGQG
jgi:hypothetical protein